MKLPKSPSAQIRWFGYLTLAIAVSFMVHEFVSRTVYFVPSNMGVVIGYTAMILQGVVTLQVAQGFKILENILDKSGLGPK